MHRIFSFLGIVSLAHNVTRYPLVQVESILDFTFDSLSRPSPAQHRWCKSSLQEASCQDVLPGHDGTLVDLLTWSAQPFIIFLIGVLYLIPFNFVGPSHDALRPLACRDSERLRAQTKASAHIIIVQGNGCYST